MKKTVSNAYNLLSACVHLWMISTITQDDCPSGFIFSLLGGSLNPGLHNDDSLL